MWKKSSKINLQTSTLAKDPKNNQLVLLVETNSIELVQVLVLRHLQLFQVCKLDLRVRHTSSLLIAFVGAHNSIGNRLFGTQRGICLRV